MPGNAVHKICPVVHRAAPSSLKSSLGKRFIMGQLRLETARPVNRLRHFCSLIPSAGEGAAFPLADEEDPPYLAGHAS
jgi:hypothetical protein